MVSSLAAQAATLVEEAPQNGIPTAAMQQVAEVLTQVAQHLDHLQYTTLRYPDGGWLTVRVVESSAGADSPPEPEPPRPSVDPGLWPPGRCPSHAGGTSAASAGLRGHLLWGFGAAVFGPGPFPRRRHRLLRPGRGSAARESRGLPTSGGAGEPGPPQRPSSHSLRRERICSSSRWHPGGGRTPAASYPSVPLADPLCKSW